MPEAQKGHPTGQPTWVETQRVAPRVSAGSCGGMWTVSTGSTASRPGKSINSFVVRSLATVRRRSWPERMGSSAASASRRDAGRLVIAA